MNHTTFVYALCTFLGVSTLASAQTQGDTPVAAPVAAAAPDQTPGRTQAILSVMTGYEKVGTTSSEVAIGLDALVLRTPRPESALAGTFGGNLRMVVAPETTAFELQAAAGIHPRISAAFRYRGLATLGYSLSRTREGWLFDDTYESANTSGGILGTRHGLELDLGRGVALSTDVSVEYLAFTHGTGTRYTTGGLFSDLARDVGKVEPYEANRDGVRVMFMLGVGGTTYRKTQ